MLADDRQTGHNWSPNTRLWPLDLCYPTLVLLCSSNDELQAGFCLDKSRHSHTFFAIIFGSPCQKMAVAAKSSTWFRHGWRKNRYAFWPRNNSCTYVTACKLATSADRMHNEQLLSETLNGSKALTQQGARILETYDQNSTWFWRNSTCPRHQNIKKPGCKHVMCKLKP
jgi:hypothetical protein